MNAAGHDVTALLQAWTAGDTDARDQLMAVLYQELHRRAAAQLRRERPGHTLQPTALVHEAYLRLIFYLAPDNKLMAAAVNAGASAFEVGDVRPLFDIRGAAPNDPRLRLSAPLVIGRRSVEDTWTYDISPDGQRFLVNTLAEEAASAPITLVVNWPALLKNRSVGAPR